jgi:hypothetical protein
VVKVLHVAQPLESSTNVGKGTTIWLRHIVFCREGASYIEGFLFAFFNPTNIGKIIVVLA